MTDVGDLFKALSGIAKAAGPVLPGPGGVIAAAAGQAFGLVSDLIDAGQDPVEGIRRIRDREPLLANVERSWEQMLEERFGPRKDIYVEFEDVEP